MATEKITVNYTLAEYKAELAAAYDREDELIDLAKSANNTARMASEVNEVLLAKLKVTGELAESIQAAQHKSQIELSDAIRSQAILADKLDGLFSTIAVSVGRDQGAVLDKVRVGIRASGATTPNEILPIIFNAMPDDVRTVLTEIHEAVKAASRCEQAAKGAAAKLAADPKQTAKNEAHIFWIEWQAARHPKLRTVEQFAGKVMRRWPVLQSTKVICGWSAEWSKETRNIQRGPTPAC